jgi:RimJ/RimL family protein N-acetyltransferase
VTQLLPIFCHHITLRRLHPGDLAAFQAYRHDPLVARYQGWSPQTDTGALAFIHNMQSATLLVPGTWCQLGIADGTSDQLLGDLGLFVASDLARAEIGFSLARAAQGQGLATEAVVAATALLFAQTQVRTVEGITDARNTASINLLERLGMQRTGTTNTHFKGQPCVEYTYQLHRPA